MFACMSRIDALIRRMTLTEKLGQLTMSASTELVTGPVLAGDLAAEVGSGAVGNVLNVHGAERVRRLQRMAVEESRLGIPLLVGLDVIHGYRTLFPVGLAEASAFDVELWARSAREAAREASHAGIAMTFAPMLDVARDPRWGRSVEGPGEDPWVAARLAEAKVRGFQGEDLAAGESLAAVAKHYCAYGAVTAGREYASADLSERTLLEVHLPAFAAAVAAGVAAVMPAFIDLAGVPMTANAPLLRGRLRERLGFQGLLISDYNSIGELIQHGVAADLVEAAALALQAGIDVDMMAGAYRHGLPAALQRGLVSMTLIDEAVRRVLTLKERLGLFDDPYRRGRGAEAPASLAGRRELARRDAARCIVMLKNRNATLPLASTVQRLALVGPLADAPGQMRGSWWAAAEELEQVSVLAGLRAALPRAQLQHASGVAIEDEGTAGIVPALRACQDAEAIILCVGEGALMSGEAASRAHLDLPGQQRALSEAVFQQAGERGTPVIVVLFSGRPLAVPWLAERADALLAAWFPGSEAGHAIADLLTGRRSPTARTPVSWPRALGQVPIFYAQRPSGRPPVADTAYASRYLDVPNEPLYAFGHGLTYGQFVLSNLRVTPASASLADTIEVRVDVVNEGARAAEETVFLFIHDVLASVARPAMELKGWSRIELSPGERGTVCLPLPARELCFLGAQLEPVFEPGQIELLVGPSADRSQLLVERIRLIADA